MLYLRQSQEREESISIEMQEQITRDYALGKGYDVVGVDVDRNLTGRRWDNRPAVQRVLERIEAREADVLVVWRLSRLSRSRKHWPIVIDRVESIGGRIESATEPLDVTTPAGRFARGVLTELTTFESEMIGQTWEDVRQRRLRHGLPVSGRLPWGWEWDHGTIRTVPEKAEIVVEMFRRYLAGDGSAAIARWLNGEGIPSPNGGIWNRVRPFTVMDSPIHAGLIPYRGEEHPGAHDGIIDTSTWSAYKSTRAARREGHERARPSVYLLSGLTRCACGLRMNGKGAVTGRKWYSGYLCTSMDPEHGPHYVSSRKIDPLVHEWIIGLAADIDRLVAGAPKIANTGAVERLTAEWSAYQTRLDRLTRLLVDEVVSEASYRATRAELEEQQHRVQVDLDAARARLARIPDVDAEQLRDLASDWPDFADDLRRRMLVALLEEVTLRPGESATFRSRWGEAITFSLA